MTETLPITYYMVRTAEGEEFEPQSDVLLKALVGMISATRM